MFKIKLPTPPIAITEVQKFPDFQIGLERETAADCVAFPSSRFEVER
jgi:hypothetical protein